MDVFKGWDNYVERIKNNWEKSITENDTVVIAGDVSWALKLNETYEDFKFIDSLPGKKILIKGNHDLWWNTASKFTDFLEKNEFNSIKFVYNNAIETEDYSVCGSRGWFFDDKQSAKKVILREAGRLNTSITKAEESGKTPLVFLHYPVYFNEQCSEEIFSVLKEHNISEVWHGHIHGFSKQPLNYEYEGVKFSIISCDGLNFAPKLIK